MGDATVAVTEPTPLPSFRSQDVLAGRLYRHVRRPSATISNEVTPP
ncbi:hypothetical protein OG767_23955 [Micromonospora sp. NBC_01392]